MNKKAKSILSVGLIVFLFSVVLLISYSFFASADVIFSGMGSITNSDIFFSPYESYVNISISDSVLLGVPGSIMNVTANFSAINTTACTGNGLLNLTHVAGNWIGNCTVSSFLTNNGSQFTPYVGNISFFSTDSNNKRNYSAQYGLPPLTILMHNLGVPNMSDPIGCTKFGPSTTNMSLVSDFNRVNFVVQIQVNFSCQTNNTYNGTSSGNFENVMLMNLTSVNMTQADIGNKLAALRTAIIVNITRPKSFGDSRIYVDSNVFSALNTSGNITLFNLPFTVGPNVLADEGTQLGASSVYWYPSGYSLSNDVSLGNLTFVVGHFSGYNATDNLVPLLTINKPTASLVHNVANVTLNLTINGTGTAVSYLTVALNSSLTLTYNGSLTSSGTANCTNRTTGGDTYSCFINQTLAEGPYTMTVTAWDFGGAAGNVNSTTRTFYVNLTRFSLDNVSSTPSSTSASIAYITNKSANISVSYGTTTSLGLNTSSTSFAASSSISLSGLSASTVYYYNVTVCDTVTNCITNGTNSFTTSASTDTTSPSGGSSGSSGSTTISPTTNLAVGIQKLMIVAETLRFSVNNEKHSIFVQSIKSGKVTLKIASDPQYITLEAGQEAKVNLNNDTTYDLYVKLNSIKSGAADLTIRTISEAMALGTTGALVQNASETTPAITQTPAVKSKVWIWIILAIGIILIGLGVWYYFFEHRRYPKF